jgi:hypothetical protein
MSIAEAIEKSIEKAGDTVASSISDLPDALNAAGVGTG